MSRRGSDGARDRLHALHGHGGDAPGQTLDLKIVAEGVETVAQQEFLTDMGCDSLQGFLFGKPMPPTQFLAALARHEALHRAEGLEGLTPVPE